MSKEQIEILINEYIDGELPKEKESFLFTQLSINDEAREYFKCVSNLTVTTKNSTEAFPRELEERIFYSIKSKTNSDTKTYFWKKPGMYLSYGFAMVLLIISLSFYNRTNTFKNQLTQSQQQINYQSQMINLLLNSSLPETNVEHKLTNEIIIEDKRDKNNKNKSISL